MNAFLPTEIRLPDTASVPVRVANATQFARDALNHLPLAQAVLLLWQQVADPTFLQDLFDRKRGRGYDKILSFPNLVELIADALLQHDGSARASFERALANNQLPVTIPAAYGKLRRLPIALSSAFLAESTARLRALLPVRPTNAIPSSLQSFAVILPDGKTIKHVARRLKLLRNVASGLVGGKTLVALELNSGLAVAMQAHPDGESSELRLVPDLIAEVQQRVAGPRLWVADRLYCDLEQTRRFVAADDHFLVRYQAKVRFYPDPAHGVRQGSDAGGRAYTDDRGWLGGTTDARRRYVRRITLTRPTDEPLILVTDLLDARRYPAAHLLAMYQARWGIENVFQQITEVFPLKHLIGGTAQAGIFQMAFCLLLYNMIHVMRAYVAAAEQWEPADVSLEKLFEDVERELIAWTVFVTPTETVTAFGAIPTMAQVRKQLTKLLSNVWQDRWLKTVNENARPHRRKAARSRTHTSIHRVLAEHRRQHSQAHQPINQ